MWVCVCFLLAEFCLLCNFLLSLKLCLATLRETNNTHNTAATCETTKATTLGRSVCVIVQGGRRKQRILLELVDSGNKFNVNRLLWWKQQQQRFYVLLSSFRRLLKVGCNPSWRFKLWKRADLLSIHSPRFRILHSPTTTLTKTKKITRRKNPSNPRRWNSSSAGDKHRKGVVREGRLAACCDRSLSHATKRKERKGVENTTTKACFVECCANRINVWKEEAWPGGLAA